MRDAACKFCGVAGKWAWNYYEKKSKLVVDNAYHKCYARDIFPGWCDHCDQKDLSLVRRSEFEFQLLENYGLPHTCTENGVSNIDDMTEAKCKHCSASGLFWVSRVGRWSLVDTSGSKHICKEYSEFASAWAEAKRMNYALEKKWIKSIPDNHVCKKCHGKGYKVLLSRNKRFLQRYGLPLSESISLTKACSHCKHIGTFSASTKKNYLKSLRKKYWPYFPGYHRWVPKNDH